MCAQWKAADAAHDSALSARAQTLIGYAGLILGAITMFAAIAAALYARRAAVATEATVGIAREASQGAESALAIAERNAEAAAEQVVVSRTSSRMQLRAWITPDAGRAVPLGPSVQGHQRGMGFIAQWKNTGASPALRAHVYTIDRMLRDDSVPIFIGKEAGADDTHDPGINVGSGQEVTARPKYLLDDDLDDWINHRLRWYIYSLIEYSDIFDEAHVSEACIQVMCQGYVARDDGQREYQIGLTYIGMQNKMT